MIIALREVRCGSSPAIRRHRKIDVVTITIACIESSMWMFVMELDKLGYRKQTESECGCGCWGCR